MRWGTFRLRASLALLSAGLAGCMMAAPAPASTPPLLWTDVERLGALCLVQTDRGVDAALGAALCERVRAIAGSGAPVPASVLAIGDPAVLDQRTVTLLVHGSVSQVDGRRFLAFTIRPFRSSSDQSGILFGATPRLAALGDSGIDGGALDSALSASLAEVLPWRQGPEGPGSIR